MSKPSTLFAIFLLDEVLPQTAKLSKTLQAVQLDLSAISSLVDSTLYMLDAAIEPSANWILQLVDAKEELATTTGVNISVPDIVAFAESIGKSFVSMLKANISSRFGSQDVIAAFSIFDPKKVPSIDSLEIKKYGEDSLNILHSHFGVPKAAKTLDGVECMKDNNIGADAWRRTGVLTFDGNIKNTQKLTYHSIKKHLKKMYAPALKISYGTVVQLCVARNRRRISSLRYKGIAQVTSRRARKGFQLRYNPDFHWSNALYRRLDYIQLEDSSDITVVDRDDASGFRLDTFATHRQYTSPVVAGSEVLTTHTDYVNRYPSVLQTNTNNP